MKTVLALFDSAADARAVVDDLLDAEFNRDQINLVASSVAAEYADDDSLPYRDIGAFTAAGPLSRNLDGGIINALTDQGVPADDAEFYAEGIRRGASLILMRASDDRARLAANIMNRHNPIDLDRRVNAWRETGWERFDNDADFLERDQVTMERDRYADRETNYVRDAKLADRDVRDGDVEEVIPVVEEEIKVGKRTVQQGGVRVHTEVEEIPVEEDVTLREEHVNVSRRPADRAADAEDWEEATDDEVIELTESAEEAVMDKRARVIEEVVISKDVDTRTETVRDTVRRTDVDVEDVDTEMVARTANEEREEFNNYEPRFREDYNANFADSGYTWTQYRPAYQYGYDLGTHSEYRERDWDEIRPEARRYWEERNEGTWTDFEDAVERGWRETRE